MKSNQAKKLKFHQKNRNIYFYKIFLRRVFIVAIFLALFFSNSFSVEAATVTWDGGGADTNWLTPANWVGDVAPTSTDSLIFTGTVRPSNNNNFPASTTFSNILIDAGGFTLAGNAITVTGGISASSTSGNTTISSGLIFNTTQTITVGLAAARTLTLSGQISGAGGLTKDGAGILTLSNSNLYTGTVSINNGTVSVPLINTNLGGTGTINFGSGTTGGILITTTQTNETITRAINLAGTTGGGTIQNNSATSTRTFSGAIGSTGAGNKTLTLKGVSTGVNTLSGIISNFNASNTTSVLATDSTWLLSGNNTFSGGVTVNTGSTVRTGNNNALGTGTFTLAGGAWGGGGNFTIPNNIVISANSTGNNLSSNTNFTGQITGTGNWAVNGFAAGKKTLSGDNSGWTGSYRISGANTLKLNHISALGSGATFTFSDGVSMGVLESLVDLSGGSGLTQNILLGLTGAGGSTSFPEFKTTANMKLSGIVSGPTGIGLNKTGAATLTFTGVNTYTGTTTISAGTLALSNANNNNIASSRLINIASGAILDTTGLSGTNDLVLASNQTLTGAGTVNGNLTMGSGSFISPGINTGTINDIGDVVYDAGGSYTWQINNATGTVGTSSGWDLENITGALNITATSGNKFNIKITSLTAGDIPGDATNFNKYSNYTWTIASTSGGITGFATSSFNISTSSFTNDITGTGGNGYFNLQVSGNNLQLVYNAAVLGTLTVDIVNALGISVSAPSINFNPINFSFDYQTTTGLFGTTSEKIRVDNPTANPQWSLSIAASSPTSFWSGTSTDYDFNDPTANAVDGGDTDVLGGQMTINPSVGTITPKGGCTNTGLTLGSSNSFSEGVMDSITLLTAGATTETGCYWDLTDISISQTIPAEQSADIYSIDMTLSIIAI